MVLESQAAVKCEIFGKDFVPSVYNIKVEAQLMRDEHTQALVRQYETQSQQVVRVATETEIRNTETRTAADLFLKTIKSEYKKIDSEEKSATRPALETVEKVRSWFRPIKAAYTQAEGLLKNKLIQWDQKVEEARRAEEDRLRDAAEKKRQADLAKAAKLEAKGKTQQAERLKEQAETMPTPAVMAPPKPKGASYTRKEWDCELTDRELIPVEHRITDWETTRKGLAAQARIRGGNIKVPGARFFLKEIAVTGRG